MLAPHGLAEQFFCAIDAAATRHPDFEDGFKATAETMRNAWHDARGDLAFTIRHS